MGKELYTNIPSKLDDLLKDVRSGRIGLPDLQRPFVWMDSKVRNLFDSMIKGYPIGYIMLWESPVDFDDKKSSIGSQEKTYANPKDLIIDGQQRLTGLVAAMYGVTIKDKNFAKRNIRITFNPFTHEFGVWTPAFERDPEWIADISKAFLAKENNTISKFRKAFITRLNEYKTRNQLEKLTDAEEEIVENSINDLLALEDYRLPSLEISYNASEEDVADIFVRVNSGGQNLNENNFILTLISVYEKEERDKIDSFCAASRVPEHKTSYNNLIEIDPVHLVRMTIGYGFRRARLQYAYMLLRGKDLKTGEIRSDIREENLLKFKLALNSVMDLNNWHGFLNILSEAGYISKKLIASSNAIVFSYVLYLIAKYEYKMDALKIRRLISKWFFMAAATYFYSVSTETEVEKQFADMRDINTADEFEYYLNNTIAARFTDDYFKITLPNELETSAAISPSWYAYLAAHNILNIPMLFSNTHLSQYLNAGASGTKNAVDKHHIFPKNYLESIGINNNRDRNQVANFTYLDYATNIVISNRNPTDYVREFREKLGEDVYSKSCTEQALPENFESMNYFEFLKERRELMAKIVKKAFDKLS